MPGNGANLDLHQQNSVEAVQPWKEKIMINTEALKTVMANRGLTHAALAKGAGISRSVVTKILLGDGDPRLSSIVGISSALELSNEEICRIFIHNTHRQGS